MSADPRRRQYKIMNSETDDMKREMSKTEEGNESHCLWSIQVNQDGTWTHPEWWITACHLQMLQDLLSTGKHFYIYILPITFILRPQSWHQPGNKHQYSDQLSGQVSEKLNIGVRGREIDDAQQRQHYESWESFWGRPGNGAPRDSVQKENLMKMLHYNDLEVKNVSQICLTLIRYKMHLKISDCSNYTFLCFRPQTLWNLWHWSDFQ